MSLQFGPPGTVVRIQAFGFFEGDVVAGTFDGAQVFSATAQQNVGRATAAAADPAAALAPWFGSRVLHQVAQPTFGGIDQTFVVPDKPPAEYPVCVYGSGAQSCGMFRIVPATRVLGSQITQPSDGSGAESSIGTPRTSGSVNGVRPSGTQLARTGLDVGLWVLLGLGLLALGRHLRVASRRGPTSARRVSILFKTDGTEFGLVLPRLRARPLAPTPALWRQRERAQGSALHPATLALDVALIALVLTAMRSPAALTLGALALVPLGLISGLYRRRTCIETQGVLWYVRALALPIALAAGLAAVAPAGGDRVDALQALGVASGVLLLVRIALWLDVSAARRRGVGMRRALVSGPGPAVAQLLRRMSAFPECGVEAVAVHTPSARADQRNPDRRQGRPDDARYTRAVDLVTSRSVDAVLVIASGSDRGSYDELVREGDGTGIEYNVVVPLAGLAGPFKPRIGDIGVVPIGQVNYTADAMRGKRAFDVVSSAFALLFLAPLLGVLALLVKLGSRGPVFYGQRRVGLDGNEFKMWKFRSMVVGADTMVEEHAHENVNDGLLFKLENDPRITRVGKILRRLSLDELPQLFNVMKGDMSFVGPRPLPVDPDAFDDLAAKRHSVRPGITGPWQVHGGHALSYDDMVGLDLAYINGWTFRHDLWLLLLTIPALLVRRAPVI